MHQNDHTGTLFNAIDKSWIKSLSTSPWLCTVHVRLQLACIAQLFLLAQGSFPSPCGAESSSSLLSEEDILAKLPQEKRKVPHLHERERDEREREKFNDVVDLLHAQVYMHT